ncbi:MAG: helix-turn-helix transcriptional regulator [Rikenellaceae bacterium]
MKRALFPRQQRLLNNLGENIKYARLRRDLSSEQLSERAGLSRSTIINIEKGLEGVAIGSYLRVLSVLGLDKDLLNVAKDDELGRILQDAKLEPKKRASKGNSLKI